MVRKVNRKTRRGCGKKLKPQFRNLSHKDWSRYFHGFDKQDTSSDSDDARRGQLSLSRQVRESKTRSAGRRKGVSSSTPVASTSRQNDSSDADSAEEEQDDNNSYASFLKKMTLFSDSEEEYQENLSRQPRPQEERQNASGTSDEEDTDDNQVDQSRRRDNSRRPAYTYEDCISNGQVDESRRRKKSRRATGTNDDYSSGDQVDESRRRKKSRRTTGTNDDYSSGDQVDESRRRNNNRRSTGTNDDYTSNVQVDQSSRRSNSRRTTGTPYDYTSNLQVDQSRRRNNRRRTAGMYDYPSNVQPRSSTLAADEEMMSVGEEYRGSSSLVHFTATYTSVVCLTRGQAALLYGYVRVRVLMGSVMIFGKKLEQEEGGINVFSSEATGVKQVEYLKPAMEAKMEQLKKTLFSLCRDFEEPLVEEFYKKITPTSVVVCTKRQHMPSSQEFVELYLPNVLATRWGHRRWDDETSMELATNEMAQHITRINDDYQVVAEKIDSVVRNAESTSTGPRIMIRGKRNSGKSTLLRYVINYVLNSGKEIYYLDADPGQTEFTPPGNVSLTKITQPLLEPPFFHMRKIPEKMMFTGSTTVTDMELYLRSVESLYKHFAKLYPTAVLFVNTMGWIHGIGALCYDEIFKVIEPTIVIEMENCEVLTEIKAERLVFNVPIIDAALSNSQGLSYITRPDWRNSAILGYLGMCIKFFMPPSYLNSITPVSVCWDDVAIFVLGKQVPPHRLVEAAHCSMVALCHVDESYMLESSNADSRIQKTIKKGAPTECIGHGFIRASDEQNHLFFIVTPLSLPELSKVNTLIKGEVHLPSVCFLKQPVYNVELPFTDNSGKRPPFCRKTVLNRSRRSVAESNVSE